MATQRQFKAVWGTSYLGVNTKEVGIEFFTDKLGYGDEDRALIASLQVGASCALDAGDHTVTRVG